jgi:hypothetical protein
MRKPLCTHGNDAACHHITAESNSWGTDDDAVTGGERRAIPSGCKEDGMVTRPPIPSWQKSSLSAPSGCTEVAHVRNEVWIRDSKNPEGPVLRCTRERWASFIAGLRGDEFESIVV